MKKQKNLAKRSRIVSSKLIDSIYLLEILEDLLDGSGKECTILSIVLKNIHIAFNETEECRKMISF